MPIYEFQCERCGKESELLVRSAHWEGTQCPHCQSTRLVKKLSVFASASKGGHDDAPACGMDPGACGGCCGGGPHHH